MKIKWDVIGRSEQPGEYPFLDGVLIVEAKHIKQWRDDAEGRYSVTQFKAIATGRPVRYLLGAFELAD